MKLSFDSVSDDGDGLSSNKENQKMSNSNSNSNSRSSERHVVREGDREQGTTHAHSTRMEQATDKMSEARDLNNIPYTGFSRGLKENKGAIDVLSLVGQQAHSKKEEMEVNSPIKLIVDQMEEKESILESTGQGIEGKRMAREKGKNKSPSNDDQHLSIGSKRMGKLVFEDE